MVVCEYRCTKECRLRDKKMAFVMDGERVWGQVGCREGDWVKKRDELKVNDGELKEQCEQRSL
jgi:hypothetical protein